MKKVLVLITIFVLTFSFNVFAMDFKTVNVTATFSEEIDFADIEKVKLIIFGEGIDYVDDASSVLNIIDLTKDNNYTKSINDTKITDQSNLFAMVDKDRYGVYNCDILLDTSLIDTANITIQISKNNFPKNEFSQIPSDIIDRIIGKSTTNNNSGNTNGNSGDNNSEDNEITVGTTTTKPTTTTNEIIYREELKKREKEEQDKKKNNIVSIVLYVIIGAILLIGLVFIMYKFIMANK